MATNNKVKIKVADTDKIISTHKGYNEVACQAKKGTAKYQAFFDLDVLKATKGVSPILTAWNRQARTDAVNAVNRPSETLPEVKALRDLAKSVKDEKVKAQLEADIQRIIDTYSPK